MKLKEKDPAIRDAQLWISRNQQGLSVEDMVEKALVPKSETALQKQERLFNEKRSREMRDDVADALMYVRALKAAVVAAVLFTLSMAAVLIAGIMSTISFQGSNPGDGSPGWMIAFNIFGPVGVIVGVGLTAISTNEFLNRQRRYRNECRRLREHFIDLGEVIE
ncbi:hypothetical protein SEA_JONJAMES_123 [Gordonia Phage JonJames]|nr:hypothetical protein SEA_JONJAMES_123 [Gordonia Phage JonJames]